MSNDKKTLADAKPGGRVRLGNALLPCPFCGAPAERIDFGIGSGENEGGSCIACTVCQHSGPIEFGYKENFISNWNRRTLSAQPSPGGQGDALVTEKMVDAACLAYFDIAEDAVAVDYTCMEAALRAALAARQPVGAAPQGCDACHRTGIRQNDEGHNICCPDCDLGGAWAGQDKRSPVQAVDLGPLWVSVNDRLPSEEDYGESGDVVVRYRYNTPNSVQGSWDVGESRHDADDIEWNNGWLFGSCDYAEVSHWMPKHALLALIDGKAVGK